jgi:hypothetical protein
LGGAIIEKTEFTYVYIEKKSSFPEAAEFQSNLA